MASLDAIRTEPGPTVIAKYRSCTDHSCGTPKCGSAARFHSVTFRLQLRTAPIGTRYLASASSSGPLAHALLSHVDALFRVVNVYGCQCGGVRSFGNCGGLSSSVLRHRPFGVEKRCAHVGLSANPSTAQSPERATQLEAACRIRPQAQGYRTRSGVNGLERASVLKKQITKRMR